MGYSGSDVRLHGSHLEPCRACGGKVAIGIWIFWEDVDQPRRVCSPACARKIVDAMAKGGPTFVPDALVDH